MRFHIARVIGQDLLGGGASGGLSGLDVALGLVDGS